METNNSTGDHNPKPSFPPRRRGQIKAQIFASLVKFVVTSFTKDEKYKGDNNGGGSAKSTPPPSDYSSDT
ncbi:hypothetical protein PHAVU_011G071000 [Phaseolus vulgaris]|uniref:Uncharacterized protein n=1 Tax=Phaseolus vulgaris TaxID=3885 RepID=V7AH37_PHAVU|nr:hypothetical protein PHAVU_011G071000g [Phaseolus vulgaris]ESW04153.1 hypothetical protein PHAVU_011G071000g [Phaseolus vulgaris]